MDLEMSRTVYVVQKQHRWDRDQQEYVPKFDLEPARQFGPLKYLLSPNAAPWRMHEVLPELHEGLVDYTEDDFLLLIGNPVLIGCAAAVAADYSGGSVRFLQWSGRDQTYIPILAEIFSQDES
jgi:hypothetical protein